MLQLFIVKAVAIHRHTGGLENFSSISALDKLIHRHTGGLEKFYAFAKEANLDDATVSAYAHFAKRIDSNKTWFDLNTNKFASEKTTVNTLFSVLSI